MSCAWPGFLALATLACSGSVERECPLDSTARDALCAFDAQREVLLDDTFLPSEVKVIQAALESWSSASGGRVSYRMVGSAAHEHALSVPVHGGLLAVVRLASSSDGKLMKDIDSAVAAKGSVKGAVVGYALPGRVMLLVERIPDLTSLEVVAMHEFGHDLGLDHSSDTQSVMHAKISGIDECVLAAPHVTTADIEALAERHCRPAAQLHPSRLPLLDVF